MKNLTDMLSRLGGEGGQEGGLGALSKLLNQNGGLQGIISKLSQNGCGEHAQSWVGQGQNKPVSGQQIQDSLDPNSVQQLADDTGQTPEQASSHVARILPEMVNQATPGGQVPEEDPLTKGLNALKRLVSSAS